MADLTVSSDIDTFMASANFAAARTNLGLELGSDIQAYDSQLEDIAGLATTDGGFIVGNGTNFVLESGATARTSLGLGSIAVLSAPSGTVVGTSDTQTLTNKTIDGDSNTLSNLDIGNEVDWAAAADVADRSAAPASGDKLLLFEAGVGLRKIDWDDLPSGGGGGGSFSLPYSDGDSVTGSDATTTFELTPTWNTTGAPTVIGVDVTDTASNAASNLIDLQTNSSPQFQVTKAGQIKVHGWITDGASAYGNIYFGGLNNIGSNSLASINDGGKIVVRSTGYFAWASGSTATTGSVDTSIYRDAANTVAQRNGTNAQTCNIYNTYTSSTNYERLAIAWDTNECILRTEVGSGGGTKRGVTINSSVSSADTVTIGSLAGLNMTGIRNIAIGDEALEAMTSGFDNVAVGHQAFHVLTSNANSCVAVGKAAGFAMTGGSGATLIGANAGNTYANMTQCTIIGNGADTSASGETGSIAIGYGIISSGTDGLNIGNVIQGTMTSSSEVIRFRGASSAAADPTTTELPTARDWGIHKNTSSGNVYLAYNDGGSIVKVQLT